jgi:hypothetical protein
LGGRSYGLAFFDCWLLLALFLIKFIAASPGKRRIIGVAEFRGCLGNFEA